MPKDLIRHVSGPNPVARCSGWEICSRGTWKMYDLVEAGRCGGRAVGQRIHQKLKEKGPPSAELGVLFSEPVTPVTIRNLTPTAADPSTNQSPLEAQAGAALAQSPRLSSPRRSLSKNRLFPLPDIRPPLLPYATAPLVHPLDPFPPNRRPIRAQNERPTSSRLKADQGRCDRRRRRRDRSLLERQVSRRVCI